MRKRSLTTCLVFRESLRLEETDIASSDIMFGTEENWSVPNKQPRKFRNKKGRYLEKMSVVVRKIIRAILRVSSSNPTSFLRDLSSLLVKSTHSTISPELCIVVMRCYADNTLTIMRKLLSST
ncbi:unnamed protein product [Sphenostylis stenocarpa]|uniref:Uncharacterized protein n=1 Tax=Sphenostylis stenocarpa TaxID=92480 RepID=A0AA86SET8_9FABA|nr:unnamed protein product [Sphenostylis stenocarpa]